MGISKKKRKALLIAFVLLFIIAAIYSIAYFTNNSYHTESQFKEYVHTYFAKNDPHKSLGVVSDKELLEYGKPASVAMRYPQTNKKGPDAYIEGIVKSAKEDFYNIYGEVEKGDKVIRFINYDTYQTQKEATGIVLYQEDIILSDGGEVNAENKRVYTYSFLTETGEPLDGINFFNGGYKGFFSQYLTEYFQKKYGDKLLEGYEQYLSVSLNTLNDFVLTDAGAKFFFQPGTIMPEKNGIVTATVSYGDMKEIVRDTIVLDAIDPEKPMVALTYDDGPYGSTSNRILDCFEKYGEVATFFELGKNVNAYPEVVAREESLGMEIGNHSWSHANLKKSTESEIASEINNTNAAIAAACGHPATLFRPPYGNTTAVVEKLAAVPVILWSVDTLDWKSRDANSVFNVVKAIHDKGALNGRVILMHSIYESTAAATEMLIPWLKENGYQLLTVSELIKYGYGEEPQAGKLYGYGYFYK